MANLTTKAIAPAAINALKEALTAVYWYKSDLRSFLMNAISDPSIVGQLNWNEYKRNIVANVVEYLAQDQAAFQGDLLRLMSEVARIEDFKHLERLEDGEEKARIAVDAVAALRKLLVPHEELVAQQRQTEELRAVALEARLRNTAIRERLEELQGRYFVLLSEEPHRRGYSLERLMKDLFDLFDLDPKASFRVDGEQVDGAFTFEGTDYLFEAKWENEPTSTKELDALSGKLSRRLDNTLGLFLSINGFSQDGVKAHSTGRRIVVLMDGSDLMAVLEGRIDLIQLLLRKRRHASQTGNIYLQIHEIL